MKIGIQFDNAELLFLLAKVEDNSALTAKWIFNNEQQLNMHSLFKREHSKFGYFKSAQI